MRQTSKYFSNRQEAGHNRFFSANGYGGYGPASYNAGFPANGDMGNGGGMPTSLPFIITVENTTGTAISDVVLFDADSGNRTAPNFGNTGGISIASAVPGTSYVRLLNQSQTQPFTVAQMLVTVLSGTASNAFEALTVEHDPANGTSSTIPLTPYKSPWQNQNDSTIIDGFYRITSYTKITINQILANTKVEYRFYPNKVADLSAGLVGRPVDFTMANPNLALGGGLAPDNGGGYF